MCRQAREMVNATEDLITVAWENHLQKLNQEYSRLGSQLSFFVPWRRLSIRAIQTWYAEFPRRPWRTGLKAAQGTGLGTFFASQKRLHEVVRGPQACLFCRLHLPTSSCSNLWRNKISDRGGGTDICRVNREGDLRVRVQHRCLIPYRPPSGGGTIRNCSQTKEETQKGKYVWPSWIYNIFLFFEKYGR